MTDQNLKIKNSFLLCRFATLDDVPTLAEMNLELIQDEGHTNPMQVSQLAERMAGWLNNQEYTAVLFEKRGEIVGYALYRPDEKGIYLRQFFVKAEFRRKGIGKKAMEWLRANPWREIDKIRLEVLIDNATGHHFWNAVGFKDYCMVMEMKNDGPKNFYFLICNFDL